MLGLATLSAYGQISTDVDVHGNLVYTNENANRPKPVAAADPKAQQPSIKEATQTAPQAAGTAVPATAAVQPAAAAPGITQVAPSPAPEALDKLVRESAEKNHVDPQLVRAVITTESNWNSRAVSSKGAQGLMQLVPGTAQSLGVGNAFDPAQNVDAGTRYLSMLLQRYDGDLNKALAAYNAGPGAVDRFGGVPNYRETRDYVQRVTSTYFQPGSERQPRAIEESVPVPIYRATAADGRVVFTNE